MVSRYSLEQKFSLVLECYKSGLSIPSWWREKGIAHMAAYRHFWVRIINNAAMMVNVKRTGIHSTFKTTSTCHMTSEMKILLDVRQAIE